MHILVCDDDAAFSAKVAEYAATYFEAHEIPVQATVCSDPEQVLAIPDLELYRIAFLDVDMPQVNGIALGGQLRHRNPDICLVYVSAYLAFALDGYKVNAYRYILKRDVAKQLPSCLPASSTAFCACLPKIRSALSLHGSTASAPVKSGTTGPVWRHW